MSVRWGLRLRTLASLLAITFAVLATQAGQRWGH